MLKRMGSGIMLTLLLTGMLIFLFNVKGSVTSSEHPVDIYYIPFFPCGITTNGTVFWVSTYVEGEYARLNEYWMDGTFTGTMYDIGETVRPHGITHDENHFYVIADEDRDCNTDYLFVYWRNGTFTGNKFDLRIPGLRGNPVSIDTDGTYLWVAAQENVRQYWKNGTYIRAFNVGAGGALGVTLYKGYILLTWQNHTYPPYPHPLGEIRKYWKNGIYTGIKLELSEGFSYPSYMPYSIAHDNLYLYVCAYRRIVKFHLSSLDPDTWATVDIIPNTLNLRSKAEYITAFIELPEGYNVSDIDVSSILLNGSIPVDADAPTAIGDYDEDGIPDLMVKFDRAEVTSYILANINMTKLIEEKFMTVTLTITGYLNDDTMFQGSDTIKIILWMPRGGPGRHIFPI